MRLFLSGLARGNTRSPKIRTIRWGKIRAQGFLSGKDMKLWPGGGRPWDWTETGTRHDPGIQVADVEELIEHGTTEIVLSRGMQLMLKTAPETLQYLRDRDVSVHIAETNEAVRIYNELAADGVMVGGLFHSTC